MAATSLTSAASAGTVEGASHRILNRAVRLQPEVAQLRGLEFLKPVEIGVKDVETVTAEALEDVDEELTFEDRREWYATLRAFRVVEPGFDPVATYISHLGEGLRGYYDTEEKELVLVQRPDLVGIPESYLRKDDEMTIAHELVHSLQDQHFDLMGFSERDYVNGDVDLAVNSLVEGDATWLMVSHVKESDPDLADYVWSELLRPLPADPLLSGMIFPYEYGPVFARTVFEQSGWPGINQAFEKPPLSSEQIRHPEKYLGPNPDWPWVFDLPDVSSDLGDGWIEVGRDAMGEIGVDLLFRLSFNVDLSAAAVGWGGDAYAIYQHGDDAEALALVWGSTWDSEDDAREFHRAAGRWLRTRADGTMAERSGTTVFSDGVTTSSLTRDGSDVWLLAFQPTEQHDAVLGRVRAETQRARVDELDKVAPVKPTEEP